MLHGQPTLSPNCVGPAVQTPQLVTCSSFSLSPTQNPVRSWTSLEHLTEPSQQISRILWTRWFITVITTARRLYQSSDKLIQFTHSRPSCSRCILILSSIILQSHTRSFLPSGFSTKILNWIRFGNCVAADLTVGSTEFNRLCKPAGHWIRSSVSWYWQPEETDLWYCDVMPVDRPTYTDMLLQIQVFWPLMQDPTLRRSLVPLSSESSSGWRLLKYCKMVTIYCRLTLTSSWWTGELALKTGNITECVPILESSELRLRGEAMIGNSM